MTEGVSVALVLFMLITAPGNEVLPIAQSFLAAEIMSLIIRLLKHIHHCLWHLDHEGGTACRTHDRKRHASRCRYDLILLHLVYTACFFVQFAQIIHIIRRKAEYKAILAGVDDRR